MYFKDKDNTNIDSEFNDNKFDIKKFKMPLIILGIVVILIIGIIVLINTGVFKKETNYFLTLEGEELITIYKGNEYVDPGYSGRDNFGNDLTNEVVVSSNIDTSVVGDYEVVYTLNDKILTRYISVVDKPVGATSIYLIGDLTMYMDINSEYVEPGYMAIDSVDSTLTDKVIVKNEIDASKVGTYYVIYSVTNSSGITIQNKRKVVVTDSEITLSLDNNNYTNKDVSIDVYVSDNYFDYLILPDGNKINNKSYTYTVSSNGEYKFTSYNKNGKESTGSITVSNIDKEKPQGTCSGSYGAGKSNISIKASDNIGISRYVIDGTSYTSSTISLNKELSKVSITIYDKAGNTNTISCSLSKVETSQPEPQPQPKPETKKGLEIHFIGSGAYDDAILIRTADKVIFIDGGDWNCRKYVTPYLKSAGITKIDVMIGSHLHRNHIATQADIMDNFEVGDIYYPDDIYTCYKRGSCIKSSQEYIIDGLNKHNKTPIVLTAPKKITVGDIELYFIAPHTIVTGGKYPENANSFIFILKYYNNTFMFTGDSGSSNMNATKLKEKADALGVSLDVDVLKYPHHGNATLNDSFLSAIKPEYVIVPNYYHPQFPNSTNKAILKKYNVQMYRQSDSSTANIFIYSDGNSIKIQSNYKLS